MAHGWKRIAVPTIRAARDAEGLEGEPLELWSRAQIGLTADKLQTAGGSSDDPYVSLPGFPLYRYLEVGADSALAVDYFHVENRRAVIVVHVGAVAASTVSD